MNENSVNTNDDGGVLGEETDTAILQMAAEDEAEEGDGGDQSSQRSHDGNRPPGR